MPMKQRITFEQLDELDKEQLTRLRERWRPQKGDWYYYPAIKHSDVINTSLARDLEHIKKDHFPLLSIGQCIELLEEKRGWEWINALVAPTYGATIDLYYEGELVDALWKAVKEVI